MTISVTLGNLANLTNQNTAVSTINNNSALITTGFTSALNTQGDKMLGTLDMNSNQIINLPSPGTNNSPVRLTDLTNAMVTGTVVLPTVIGGTNISTSGTGTITISTVTSPTWTTATIGTLIGSVTASTITVSTITVSTGSITSLTSSSISSSALTASSVNITGSMTTENITCLGDLYIKGGNPWADVRAFGAVNGAESTSSIQAAINSMSSAGGWIFFPPGNYLTSSTITVPGNCFLIGCGANNTFISLGGHTSDKPVVSFTTGNNGAKDMAFFGCESAGMTSSCVSLGGASGYLKDCTTFGGSYGLNVSGNDWRIYNCYPQGYTGCVYTTGSNFYTDCKFDNNLSGCLYGVNIAAGSGQLENQFLNTDFSGVYTYSVNVNDGGANSALSKFVGCVLSSRINLPSHGWTAFTTCEIGITGTTSFVASSTTGVVTMVGNYCTAGSLSTSVAGTKEYSANFGIV